MNLDLLMKKSPQVDLAPLSGPEFVILYNFVNYICREGGYLDSDQFSLLLFPLFMGGGGGQKGNSAKFIISSAFFLTLMLM